MGPQLLTDDLSIIRRLFRKAVQQGRSKQRGESYSVPYVEPLRDARTLLAAFVNSLIVSFLCTCGIRPLEPARKPSQISGDRNIHF